MIVTQAQRKGRSNHTGSTHPRSHRDTDSHLSAWYTDTGNNSVRDRRRSTRASVETPTASSRMTDTAHHRAPIFSAAIPHHLHLTSSCHYLLQSASTTLHHISTLLLPISAILIYNLPALTLLIDTVASHGNSADSWWPCQCDRYCNVVVRREDRPHRSVDAREPFLRRHLRPALQAA